MFKTCLAIYWDNKRKTAEQCVRKNVPYRIKKTNFFIRHFRNRQVIRLVYLIRLLCWPKLQMDTSVYFYTVFGPVELRILNSFDFFSRLFFRSYNIRNNHVIVKCIIVLVKYGAQILTFLRYTHIIYYPTTHSNVIEFFIP